MAKNTVVVTEDELEQQFREDKKFAVQLLDSEYRESASGGTSNRSAGTFRMTIFMTFTRNRLMSSSVTSRSPNSTRTGPCDSSSELQSFGRLTAHAQKKPAASGVRAT